MRDEREADDRGKHFGDFDAMPLYNEGDRLPGEDPLGDGFIGTETFEPDGSLVYNLKHRDVGPLGRVILRINGEQPELSSEVSDVDDGLRTERERLIGHFVKTLESAQAEAKQLRDAWLQEQRERRKPESEHEQMIGDVKAMVLMNEALLLEKQMEPWPTGVTAKRKIQLEDACWVYKFMDDRTGDIGSILIRYEGENHELLWNTVYASDGHDDEREVLMTELCGIVNGALRRNEKFH